MELRPLAKRLRVYKLYDGPSGPTEKSVYYGQLSKNVYHVAAVGVADAKALVKDGRWSDGGPGILEYSDHSQKWHSSNGTAQWTPNYKPGQLLP